MAAVWLIDLCAALDKYNMAYKSTGYIVFVHSLPIQHHIIVSLRCGGSGVNKLVLTPAEF